MASRFLFDTSALIAHNRQEPGWARVQAIFEEGESEILIASVSLTEFARRLRELGATEAEARRTVEDYLELFDEVVPVDEGVAFIAFDIGCAVEKRLPLTDALIAAAAQRRGAHLVHRDPSHGQFLQGSSIPALPKGRRRSSAGRARLDCLPGAKAPGYSNFALPGRRSRLGAAIEDDVHHQAVGPLWF